MFLNDLEKAMNYTTTENGGVAYKSSLDGLLDAFAVLGNPLPAEDALRVFYRAWAQDPKLALRMLFYMRDVRGGQGRRDNFRVILKDLARNKSCYVIKNIDNIPYFGRYDDLFILKDTPCEAAMVDYVFTTLLADVEAMVKGEEVTLLAKWMPSINTSSKETRELAKFFCKAFGWNNERRYRQILSKLRAYLDVTEVKMSSKRWEEIDYAAVPSKAMLNYNSAFNEHDGERLMKFYVEHPEAINAGALFPVDIVHRAWGEENYLHNIMWNNLPNYVNEDENALCVVDVSGSMCGTPMEVAVSLGLYCAQRGKGPFKDAFITFSRNPSLCKISDELTLHQNIRNMERADWGQNTDIVKVFRLILDTALANKTPQEELPKKIYIISDMQFDSATSEYWWDREKLTDLSVLQTVKAEFEKVGYQMPSLVYWNVRNSAAGMFQETVGDAVDCCMVSGYSPSLFKAVAAGTTYSEELGREALDPISVMMAAIGAERYDRVVCDC